MVEDLIRIQSCLDQIETMVEGALHTSKAHNYTLINWIYEERPTILS